MPNIHPTNAVERYRLVKKIWMTRRGTNNGQQESKIGRMVRYSFQYVERAEAFLTLNGVGVLAKTVQLTYQMGSCEVEELSRRFPDAQI